MASDEYRRNAIECLQLADGISDTPSRLLLIHMAQAWLRLADQAEKNLTTRCRSSARHMNSSSSPRRRTGNALRPLRPRSLPLDRGGVPHLLGRCLAARSMAALLARQ